ncbi:MAG: CHAT domain-containing protein [Candidatus Nanopelagicales bacterium]
MRTVVGFEPFGDITVCKLEDAPADVPGIRENVPCDVSPLPIGSVIERGSALAVRLQAHPAVRAGLEQLLARPPASTPAPLYFHVVSGAADELPWEQVYAAPDGFWALDQRWPVGRISRRRRPLADRAFATPLMILVVLAAAGQSGVRQLRAILAATTEVDREGLDVRVHVLSAEPAVADAVRLAALPHVSHEILAGTPAQVGAQIAAARPQLVHLLCHGGSTAGVRTLALATLADYDSDEPTGSVRLKVSDLSSALAPVDPWLVVLAACESAQAADGPALAHDLVNSGLPAVIGMRRLVDLAGTNRFCEALYPELLRAVQAAVTPAVGNGDGHVRILEWAECLTAPRAALGAPDPADSDAWTDPVLYVQEEPLRVFPPSPVLSPTDFSAIRAELDVYLAFRASLDPATTPAGLLAEVDGKIGGLRVRLGEA